ncbi:MAG: hypothetical protein ACTJG2_00990 [Candidatus Saccharimonadales bacterium]
MKTLLGIANDNRHAKQITFPMILKADILPWTASIGSTLVLFLGVSILIGSISKNMSGDDLSAVVYSAAAPLLYGLIFLTVLFARRTIDAQMWIISAALIFIVLPQHFNNIANHLFTNSIFESLVALTAILCIERLYEYAHTRYVVKLSDPHLSTLALATYILILAAAMILLIPIFRIFIV